jgi:predicted RNA methylase
MYAIALTPEISSENLTSEESELPQATSFFFQPLVGIEINQLKMTEVSLYSTTPWKESNYISKTIINFYNSIDETIVRDSSPIVITDGTAHVGGNAINFHLNGMIVNAVEIDPLIVTMLVHNFGIYKIQPKSVCCCDYGKNFQNLTQDVIFLDPPWGGSEYKNQTDLDLFLGQLNVAEICLQIFKKELATLVVLKVPINYNLTTLEFLKNETEIKIMIQKIYRSGNRHSYNVIYLGKFCHKK